MKFFVFSIFLYVISASGLFAEDFRNLTWGMSQQEVVAIIGAPESIAENKLVFGIMTQTYTYKDEKSDSPYDLLFLENMLTNASYKIAATKKASANDVHRKFREETVYLEERFKDLPVLVEKMDNSTKKYVYEDANTKVTVIYYNTPIKADYVNRNAYLVQTIPDLRDDRLTQIQNLKIDRARAGE